MASRAPAKIRAVAKNIPSAEGGNFIQHHYENDTAKVRRDLLESQKKYMKNKYCKYNEVKKCSKGKHILRRGFKRRYCSIPINV